MNNKNPSFVSDLCHEVGVGASKTISRFFKHTFVGVMRRGILSYPAQEKWAAMRETRLPLPRYAAQSNETVWPPHVQGNRRRNPTNLGAPR